MSEPILDLDSAKNTPEHPHAHRPIRSFVLRQGHLSKAQARAINELMPVYGIPYQAHPLDYPQVFVNAAPTIVEIGFGMGTATAQIAAQNPQNNYIGVEVHTPGVGSLLNLIEEQQLTNVRIIQHDAVEVFKHTFAPDSLDGVHVFFPDPWHKARHHKRRLIKPDFVALLVSRLKEGGYLHIATDWENYAEQILSVLSANPQLKNTAENYAPRPAYRPLTKFEQRGLNLGHGVWDVIFTKTP